MEKTNKTKSKEKKEKKFTITLGKIGVIDTIEFQIPESKITWFEKNWGKKSSIIYIGHKNSTGMNLSLFDYYVMTEVIK